MVKELTTEGYSVKDSCKALGVSRSRYYSFQKQGKITITERMSDMTQRKIVKEKGLLATQKYIRQKEKQVRENLKL